MNDPLPPAIDGTQMRLDAVLAELRALRGLLTPAAKAEPKDGEAVELREPKTAPKPQPRAKRR